MRAASANDNHIDPIFRMGLQLRERLLPDSRFDWFWLKEAAARFSGAVGDVLALEPGLAVITEAWLENGRPLYRTDASTRAYGHDEAPLMACDPMGAAAPGDLVRYWDGQAWAQGALLRSGGRAGLTVTGPGGRPRLTTIAITTRRAGPLDLARGHGS